MPTISRETLSPTRVRLSITVQPEELRPSIENSYQQIAQQIQMPGFRKGKVPPPLVDQRVGRKEVLSHAVNESLDSFFQGAIAEEKIRTLGRPQAEIKKWPDEKDFSGELVVDVEVDVRPDFDLPELGKYVIEVDPILVTKGQVEDELDALRTRFGNLVSVDRPAKDGDFLQIDLTAKIEDRTIDSASSVSYELGSGQLIDGIDAALETLTAGEETTFESKLLGGDHEGQTALISVTVLTVKERQLPDADDDFAQIASQFDTLEELKADLKSQVRRKALFRQAQQARDNLVERMLAEVSMPLPEAAVQAEVTRHLENENRLDDVEHREEVVRSTEKSLRTQLLLDALVESMQVQVSQEELTQYLFQSATQYGMEPSEFIESIDQSGQLPSMVGEVARSKSLSMALGEISVKDSSGKKVDLTEFAEAAASSPGEKAKPKKAKKKK